MSYIIKNNYPLVNLKLTDTGRENLSLGFLNYKFFGLGDGEMDYTNPKPALVNILRPVDNNSDIIHHVPSQGTNNLENITLLNSVPTVIHKPAKTRGVFNTGVTSGYTTQINSTLTSVYNITGTGSTTGSTTVVLKYVTGTTQPSSKNNNYKKIKNGDYLLVKILQNEYYHANTSKFSNNIDINPTQYLTYQITSVNGAQSLNISGITNNTNLTLTLDRPLPKFTKPFYIKGFVFPGVNTISDYYDNPTPIAYWSQGLLDFSSNDTSSPTDVPVWNMNIIYNDNLIGLDDIIYKGKNNVISKNYWGTAIDLGYFDENRHAKIGVIHYTNNTVSNFYGEGFYKNTTKLYVPHIMWHKKQFGGAGIADELGYTFISDSTIKFIDNKTRYYDLIDQETTPTIVGKVLIDEKIIIIDHQELLSVLSLKANRNWTLPQPKVTMVDVGHCQGGNITGTLQPNEEIHISYLFTNSNGITGIQCEDYVSIQNTTLVPKDILFEYPRNPSDPTYSELGYLMDYGNTSGIGFTVNGMILLWQKTPLNFVPDPAGWHYFDISIYLGTNGCLTNFMETGDHFELFTESTIYSTSNTYNLTKLEIGDVIVSLNGLILKEATTLANIGVDGDYFSDITYTPSLITINPLILTAGDTLQFSYLIGAASTSATIRQQIDVPATGIPIGNTYLDGIYTSGGKTELALTKQPNSNVVYIFYNGQLISSNNYGVYTTGGTQHMRVELTFTPANRSTIILFYLDNAALGTNPRSISFTSDNMQSFKTYIDNDLILASKNRIFNVNDYVSIPALTATGATFGDEVMFMGNVDTEIKATIYKTLFTCNVLPNKFTSSINPTFNANTDKAAFTEIGIYDANTDLVAIGKFSQPLTRKYNSDILVIQATIDF